MFHAVGSEEQRLHKICAEMFSCVEVNGYQLFSEFQ